MSQGYNLANGWHHRYMNCRPPERPAVMKTSTPRRSPFVLWWLFLLELLEIVGPVGWLIKKSQCEIQKCFTVPILWNLFMSSKKNFDVGDFNTRALQQIKMPTCALNQFFYCCKQSFNWLWLPSIHPSTHPSPLPKPYFFARKRRDWQFTK